jgi:hypothetical protein
MISNAAEALESVSFATMLFWLSPAGTPGVRLFYYPKVPREGRRVAGGGLGSKGRHLLLISGHGHRLSLYAFPDDPDQGNRIEFEKVDWNAAH